MRPRLTLALACLLAAASLWPASRLGIRSDVEAMLASATTPEAIAAGVGALRDAAEGPGALFLSSIAAADPLGLAGRGLHGLTPASALPFDPVTGVLLSRDQRAVLLVVTPVRA